MTTQFLNTAMVANLGDATDGNVVFFNEELTRIVSELYETKYRAIKYRDYFNIDNEGGAGITSVKMRVWDMVGSAKIIGHFSDDLPAAGVGAAETTVGVKFVGASFHVDWFEVQQAQLVGRSIENMRARACDRAIEQKMNGIAFGTDEEATDAGLFGLLSHPNIPQGTVAAGASGETEWADKTPNEILIDVNNLFSTMSNTTFDVFRPNRLALPIKQFNLLANTRLNDISSDTILDHIISKSPYITGRDAIIVMPELAGAGEGGEDVMMAYDDDPQNAVFYIPYEKGTPVGTLPDGLAFKTPVVASTGGLDVRYPLAFSKTGGI